MATRTGAVGTMQDIREYLGRLISRPRKESQFPSGRVRERVLIHLHHTQAETVRRIAKPW
ncbi:MAG: hypothetical protein JO055_07600 [Alphaproteobacteria bacterium]|nr:hypothetical protein [Alphaproteobacteria bacterium]